MKNCSIILLSVLHACAIISVVIEVPLVINGTVTTSEMLASFIIFSVIIFASIEAVYPLVTKKEKHQDLSSNVQFKMEDFKYSLYGKDVE